jgi:hypothetical protein
LARILPGLPNGVKSTALTLIQLALLVMFGLEVLIPFALALQTIFLVAGAWLEASQPRGGGSGCGCFGPLSPSFRGLTLFRNGLLLVLTFVGLLALRSTSAPHPLGWEQTALGGTASLAFVTAFYVADRALGIFRLSPSSWLPVGSSARK